MRLRSSRGKKKLEGLSESDQLREIKNSARTEALSIGEDMDNTPVDNSNDRERNDPPAPVNDGLNNQSSTPTISRTPGINRGVNTSHNPQYVRVEDLIRLLGQFFAATRFPASTNVQQQPQQQSNDPINSNDERDSTPRRFPAREPEDFKPKMDFTTWKTKFDLYYEINEFDEKKKLQTLKLFMDDVILRDIGKNGDFNNYELLCRYLMRTYTSGTSEFTAGKELKCLMSRKMRYPEEIESIAEKIDSLVEAKLPGSTREVILKEKNDTLSFLLPPECQTIFDNSTNHVNFHDAVSTAKAIWLQLIQTEVKRHKGQSITGKSTRTENSLEMRCYLCNRIGHVKSRCPEMKKDDDKDNYECNVIQTVNNINYVEKINEKEKMVCTKVTINGKITTALVDTGSNCVVINPSLNKKLNLSSDDADPVSGFQMNNRVKEVKEKVKIGILGDEYLVSPVIVSEKDFPNKKYNIIRGMNLLKATNAIIDLRKGKLVKCKKERKKTVETLQKKDNNYNSSDELDNSKKPPKSTKGKREKTARVKGDASEFDKSNSEKQGRIREKMEKIIISRNLDVPDSKTANDIRAVVESENDERKSCDKKKFDKGELIMLSNVDENTKPKFKMKYNGPFKVTRQEGVNVFYRRPSSRREIKSTISKVKVYNGDSSVNVLNDHGSFSKEGEVRNNDDFK